MLYESKGFNKTVSGHLTRKTFPPGHFTREHFTSKTFHPEDTSHHIPFLPPMFHPTDISPQLLKIKHNESSGRKKKNYSVIDV